MSSEAQNERSSSIQPTSKTTIDSGDRSQRIMAQITLEGDLELIPQLKVSAAEILREYGGATIKVEVIRHGSKKISFFCTPVDIEISILGLPEDIERLNSRIESGELSKIDGVLISEFEVFSEERLAEEIRCHSVEERNLAGTNLAGTFLVYTNLVSANLSGVNLTKAKLSFANFTGANFTNANLTNANLNFANFTDADLSGVNLTEAKLSFANFTGSNLTNANFTNTKLSFANLTNANLTNANLSGTNFAFPDLIDPNFKNLSFGETVTQARFGNNNGLSNSLRKALEARGAIFEDISGDRSDSC